MLFIKQNHSLFSGSTPLAEPSWIRVPFGTEGFLPRVFRQQRLVVLLMSN